MLTFNTLLELASVDPKKVFLLRHEDSRLPRGRTIYSAWCSEKPNFEKYQQTQKWKNRFPEGSALASFVVAPDGATLFVGIYEVLLLSRMEGPLDEPLLGPLPPDSRACHDLKYSHHLKEYVGKLVIDWGGGTRA